LYRLPVSTVLDWSPVDQLAAVASIQNEQEACPGCGLRPDQHRLVEADLSACPGCDARAAVVQKLTAADSSRLVGFFPVSDTRLSVWARYTQEGARWTAEHRHRPDGLFYNPDEED